MRILVSGAMVGPEPQGGAASSLLQWVHGLSRLAHEVMLIEPVQRMPDNDVYSYFSSVAAAAGFGARAAILVDESHATLGLRYYDVAAFASKAELLINVSGTLRDRRLLESIPVRLYLDLDPAFNQLWHVAEGVDMNFDGHTHFATVGQAIGSPDCDVPTAGIEWIPTLPPVVMEEWPAGGPVVHDAFTTVANWRAYGSIHYRGVQYGQKAHSLRPLIALPTRTDERFLLALSIHPDEERDLEALRANRWELVDPADVAATPDDYRDFVRGSKGELGIAKSGYVVSRCGWFSDRSACYLASGRPVIAQETGFSRYLPTGEGLFSFATMDDVLTAVDEINRDYERHARAARAIAEEYFDSDVVLPRLLEQVGVA